jgi:hypothetical protein
MIKKKKKKTVFNNISNFLNNEGVKYIYMLCDVPQWYRLAFFFQVHLKGWWGKKKKGNSPISGMQITIFCKFWW